MLIADISSPTRESLRCYQQFWFGTPACEKYDSHNSMTKIWLVDMGVSLNGGTPNLHPKKY